MEQEKKLKLPSADDDWSSVDAIISKCVLEHLGEQKVFGEFQQRDYHDCSEYPVTQEEEIWTGDDLFIDLMEQCTGNTVATYLSGSGLRSERISEILFEQVDDAVRDIMLVKNGFNPSDYDAHEEVFEYGDNWLEIQEIVSGVFDEIKNKPLSEWQIKVVE
tara:strand:- start:594 stop:1076 length:483 start_codon:yes stop_codon:yes gene_type:complete